MRTSGESSEREIRPPDTMQPSATSESIAVPTRSPCSSLCTNFAGGRWRRPVRIGHSGL